MGSGKTTAAIKYMNDHPGKKFIYVTPYLDETERIQKGCPGLRFFLPNNWDNKHRTTTTKRDSARIAIQNGFNVATTHALFNLFDDEMRKAIRKHGYTLILDEALDVIRKLSLSPYDVKLIEQAGVASVDERTSAISMIEECSDKESRYYEITESMRIGTVYKHSRSVFLSLLSPQTVRSFEHVVIMTYMFDAQFQRGLFELNGLEYERLYVEKNGNVYQFTHDPLKANNPLKGIRDLVTITNYSRTNDIGKHYFALSSEWYKADFRKGRQHRGLRHKKIANNSRNMVRRGFRDGGGRIRRDDLLWTCYKNSAKEIDCYELCYDKKFFAPCTTKATNAWSDRHYLIYLVNRFCDPNFKSFFASKNIDINDDFFALSELVQWVWRSAIRNGEHIYIYIPSSRMRALFVNWLDYVSTHDEPYTVDCMPNLKYLRPVRKKAVNTSLIKKEYTPVVDWNPRHRKD